MKKHYRRRILQNGRKREWKFLEATLKSIGKSCEIFRQLDVYAFATNVHHPPTVSGKLASEEIARISSATIPSTTATYCRTVLISVFTAIRRTVARPHVFGVAHDILLYYRATTTHGYIRWFPAQTTQSKRATGNHYRGLLRLLKNTPDRVLAEPRGIDWVEATQVGLLPFFGQRFATIRSF